MRLVRLKKAWLHEIKEVLDYEGIQNSYNIAEIISSRFTVLTFKKKSKQNPLWRLTILFYLLFFLLIIISIPVKYLITGTGQYEFESKIGKIYRAWQVKLGL